MIIFTIRTSYDNVVTFNRKNIEALVYRVLDLKDQKIDLNAYVFKYSLPGLIQVPFTIIPSNPSLTQYENAIVANLNNHEIGNGSFLYVKVIDQQNLIPELASMYANCCFFRQLFAINNLSVDEIQRLNLFDENIDKVKIQTLLSKKAFKSLKNTDSTNTNDKSDYNQVNTAKLRDTKVDSSFMEKVCENLYCSGINNIKFDPHEKADSSSCDTSVLSTEPTRPSRADDTNSADDSSLFDEVISANPSFFKKCNFSNNNAQFAYNFDTAPKCNNFMGDKNSIESYAINDHNYKGNLAYLVSLLPKNAMVLTVRIPLPFELIDSYDSFLEKFSGKNKCNLQYILYKCNNTTNISLKGSVLKSTREHERLYIEISCRSHQYFLFAVESVLCLLSSILKPNIDKTHKGRPNCLDYTIYCYSSFMKHSNSSIKEYVCYHGYCLALADAFY